MGNRTTCFETQNDYRNAAKLLRQFDGRKQKGKNFNAEKYDDSPFSKEGHSGRYASTSDSEFDENLFEIQPLKDPAVIRIESDRTEGKPCDVESIESAALSSNASDFTSPRENDGPESPALSLCHSEAPSYNDNSEPPTLVVESLTPKERTRKTVSFAQFAQILESLGGNDEVFITTPHNLEGNSYAPTPSHFGIVTPSMNQTPISVRSVGFLPSTPSLEQLYLDNHEAAKSNFYTQTGRTVTRGSINAKYDTPQIDQMMYIKPSPSDTAALEVPASVRSVGPLPPTPILDDMFLDADPEPSLATSYGSEPKPNVLWGMPESDTDSDDESDEYAPQQETDAEDSSCDASDSETSVSSIGGDDFCASKAWFTTEKPDSPSFLSYSSFGGGEMS